MLRRRPTRRRRGLAPGRPFPAQAEQADPGVRTTPDLAEQEHSANPLRAGGWRNYATYEVKFRARESELLLPNPWRAIQAMKVGCGVMAMAGVDRREILFTQARALFFMPPVRIRNIGLCGRPNDGYFHCV